MIPGLFLVLLSMVWGYAVFEYGGVARWERTIVLCALGAVALAYRIAMRRRAAPAPGGRLGWAILLLPAYIAVQMAPLPLGLLGGISPRRIETIRAFQRVGASGNFATLSVNPEATMREFLLVCGYTLLFLTIRDIGGQFSKRRWLAAAPIIAAGALEAALGLAQVFNGQEGTGTYVNRNHYAALLEMTLPFALMQAISIWRGTDTRRDSPMGPALRTCLLLGLSALMLLGIVYSLSRMGFGAALCSLLAMGAVAQAGAGRKWPLSIALLSAGVVAMFVFLPPDRMISRFAPFSSAEGISGESRLRLWSESVGVFRDYPIVGCGLGGFESVFLRYKASDPLVSDAYVHNDYLQFLIELGVAGFAIAVTLFACIGGAAARALSHGRDRDARCLAIACVGAFTAIGMHSFADFNLYIPANAMLLAWICGICASLEAGANGS